MRPAILLRAEDEKWIPVVAANRWIIVTRDIAIKRRATEREAWIAAKAVVVSERVVYCVLDFEET